MKLKFVFLLISSFFVIMASDTQRNEPLSDPNGNRNEIGIQTDDPIEQKDSCCNKKCLTKCKYFCLGWAVSTLSTASILLVINSVLNINTTKSQECNRTNGTSTSLTSSPYLYQPPSLQLREKKQN